MSIPSFARRERRALCDLAILLGSDAPTLCGDWTAQDLVVHLLVRERRPLGALGIVVPGLARLTRRSTERLERQDFPSLVQRVREPGPIPFALGPIEPAVNTVEMFVHHEDLRRAQPGWGPRDLSGGDEDVLWRVVGLLGRVLARPAGVPVRAVRSETGAATTLVGGAEPATVTGRPGELALYLFGREQVDGVELDGPQDKVARVRGASLGF